VSAAVAASAGRVRSRGLHPVGRLLVVAVAASIPVGVIATAVVVEHRQSVSVPAGRVVESHCIDHTITQDFATATPGELLAVGTEVKC
jgi:hypothetical protein